MKIDYEKENRQWNHQRNRRGMDTNQRNRTEMDTNQRKLRYRELLNAVDEINSRENLGERSVKDIGEIFKEANELCTKYKIEDRIDCTDETLLECLVVSSASNVMRKCVEAVDCFSSTYEQDEFTDKITNEIKGEANEEIIPTDFLKLLKDSREIIPQCPKCEFVYGSYDLFNLPVPKQKKERQKTVKEQVQKKSPRKIVDVPKDEEGIEEIVTVMCDALTEQYNKTKQPVKYYDYVIDTNFGNTVENIFYFSFLIRDGRAAVDLDAKGEPVIKPITKNELQQYRDHNGINSQVISTINMKMWKNMKKEGLLQKYKRRHSKK